jgi:hypothetical protein
MTASDDVNKEQRVQPSVDGWLLCHSLRHLPPDPSSAAFVCELMQNWLWGYGKIRAEYQVFLENITSQHMDSLK